MYIIVGVIGTTPKTFNSSVDVLDIWERIENAQNTASLVSARRLRNVLEICGNLDAQNFQR